MTYEKQEPTDQKCAFSSMVSLGGSMRTYVFSACVIVELELRRSCCFTHLLAVNEVNEVNAMDLRMLEMSGRAVNRVRENELTM